MGRKPVTKTTVHLWAAAMIRRLSAWGRAPWPRISRRRRSPPRPSIRGSISGRWYEIARLPNKNPTELPGADLGLVETVGRRLFAGADLPRRLAIGPTKTWRAGAKIIDATRNAKVRVGFFGGFIHQDYWIVDRGEDNSWCIMSTPTSKYVWIMSRRAVMPSAEKAALAARARSLGYDTSRLIYDEQPPA